jgi:signal transduction histidine kinase
MSIIGNLSIRNKLILLMLLVSIPALILGFSIVIIRDVFQLKQELVNKTRLDAELVAEYFVGPMAFKDKKGAEEIMSKLGAVPNIESACVYDEDGLPYVTYNKSNKEFTPPPFSKEKYHEFEGDYFHLWQPIIYNKNQFYGAIYLRTSIEPLQQNIRSRIRSILLIMVGLIVFSYLLALRFQGRISKPILRLAGITEKISHHSDYSVRVRHEGRDEIGVLYQGFNNMLEQIQVGQKKRDEAEAEQQRLMVQLEEKNKELEQVIYVTSHDLRSPLVNIQGFGQEMDYSLRELRSLMNQIDNIPQDIKNKINVIFQEDIRESLKYIEAGTAKMDSLLSGLLKLSRVGRMPAVFDFIDMNRLIADILNAFEFQLKEKEVKLRVEQLPPCFGNEMQINQLFSNLVSNALKYLDPGRPGIISITGTAGTKEPEENGVVYCVADNGIGIPGEYQTKIFEIFYRLNPLETQGEGLGLTIVSKIVSRHNGRLWVESEPGKGSRFFVSLPKSDTITSGSADSDGPAVPGPVLEPDR